MSRRTVQALELAARGFRVAIVDRSRNLPRIEELEQALEPLKVQQSWRILESSGSRGVIFAGSSGRLFLVAPTGIRGLTLDAVFYDPRFVDRSEVVPAVATSRLGLVVSAL